MLHNYHVAFTPETRTPPALASAAVAMIADCDPDQCFEEGLDLMLAGLAAPPGSWKKRSPNRA